MDVLEMSHGDIDLESKAIEGISFQNRVILKQFWTDFWFMDQKQRFEEQVYEVSKGV